MAISIIDWLKSKTRFTFDDKTFEVVIEERKVSNPQTPFSNVESDIRRLMFADMLEVAYNSPTGLPSYSNSHGEFKESWGSEENKDREDLWLTFMAIYEKLDPDKFIALKEEQIGKINASEVNIKHQRDRGLNEISVVTEIDLI